MDLDTLMSCSGVGKRSTPDLRPPQCNAVPAPPPFPQGGKIPKALEELIKEEEEEKADQEIQVG